MHFKEARCVELFSRPIPHTDESYGLQILTTTVLVHLQAVCTQAAWVLLSPIRISYHGSLKGRGAVSNTFFINT